ncbi:hypothetical protein DPMN_152391 [Dreissena polymorpha]|uniref:Sushi domain-containing protein n=1 Tax=Dreissena polymorpha TaxID=45954 RepID=A0A9D4FH57_DREPO|nr:hypothetical protein DPMN_152391 [Dreissena polymorpha]
MTVDAGITIVLLTPRYICFTIAVITCSEPDDVRDATKTFGGVQPGSVVTYRCNHGYTSSGDLMRTCTPTGGWSGVQPTCTR